MNQIITSLSTIPTFLFIKVHSIGYVISCIILLGIITLRSYFFKSQRQKNNLEDQKRQTVANESNEKQSLEFKTVKQNMLVDNPIMEKEKVLSIEEKSVNATGRSKIDLELNSIEEALAKEEISKKNNYINLPNYEFTSDLTEYKYPNTDLLEVHEKENLKLTVDELEDFKSKIISTFTNHGIVLKKITATVGPTFTLYEIVPESGVNISRIKRMDNDLTLRLATQSVNIIAPIPGKGTIGIEVPNFKRGIVSLRTLISSEEFKLNNYKLPISLGKKMNNENLIVDLSTMPHLLIAGSTGQGKSVCLDSILLSVLYKKHPSQLKLILIDLKGIKLNVYKHIENHFLAKLQGEDAIVSDQKKIVPTLNALCIEMDMRYDLLKEADVRNIIEYNQKFIERKLLPEKGHRYLPFIILVISEFADIISNSSKDVELLIARLAQSARSAGIHIIIATQRPSINIITGTIKANFSSRIAFSVPAQIDSRTILDIEGAEKLKGNGDMLVSYNNEITRLQGAYVNTHEVEAVVNFIGKQQGYPQPFLLPKYVDEKEINSKEFDLADRDPLFEEAARLIVQNQMGSTSLIRRRMKLGYNRAGHLMDQLEAAGIVGPNMGSKARVVIVRTEAELYELL